MKLTNIWGGYLRLNDRLYSSFSNFINKFPWLALMVVMILFTGLKWGSFHNDFTGYYQAKYATYTDPALSMVEHNTPFLYQVKYLVTPDNLQGLRDHVDLFPVMEWLMFFVYKFSPFESLYFNTRILVHFVALVTLLCGFIFFRKLFQDKLAAILAVLFLSTNVMFVATSFIPVLDTITLSFAFLALAKILDFINEDNSRNILFAGILTGFGVIIKYSLFLWLVPLISFWLIGLSFKRGIHKSLLFLGLFLINTLLVMLAFKYNFCHIVSEFASDRLLAAISLIPWIIFISMELIFFEKWSQGLQSLINWVFRNPWRIIVCLFLVSASLFVLADIFTRNYNKHFLSTYALLSNLRVYIAIGKQLLFDIHWSILAFALLGLIFLKDTKEKSFIASLFIANIFFLISALMSFFFHGYYRLPVLFMIVVLAVFGSIIFIKKGGLIPAFFLLCFLWISIYMSVQPLLAMRRAGFEEALLYLKENTKKEELFVDGQLNVSLSLISRRRRVSIWSLDNKYVKNQIQKKGLYETMKSLGINYFISSQQGFSLYPFANLFSDFPLENNNDNKILEQVILNVANNIPQDPLGDIAIRNRLIEEEKISEKLYLERQIGDYYFIRFKEHKR